MSLRRRWHRYDRRADTDAALGRQWPRQPPDHGDAPDEYSKNAEGEVCLCGPYEIGCTTDPDGTPGDEPGREPPAAPSDCYAAPDTYFECGAACRAQCGERMAIGDFSPSIFKFVTTVADDGNGEVGQWIAPSPDGQLRRRLFRRALPTHEQPRRALSQDRVLGELRRAILHRLQLTHCR